MQLEKLYSLKNSSSKFLYSNCTFEIKDKISQFNLDLVCSYLCYLIKPAEEFVESLYEIGS